MLEVIIIIRKTEKFLEKKTRQIDFLGQGELSGSMTDKGWLGHWIRVDGATKIPASLAVS